MSGTQLTSASRRPIKPRPPAEQEWRRFERALAATLADLAEDRFLVIEAKRGTGYVQFAGDGAFGMRAEAVANAYLADDRKLSPDTAARVLALGWGAPSAEPLPGESHAEPPRNFWLTAAAPVPYARVARLAVQTLRDGYGIPHPSLLQYAAFTMDGESIRFPALRLKHRPRTRPSQASTSSGSTIEPPRAASGASAAPEWRALQRPNERVARVCDAQNQTVAVVQGQAFGEALGRARLMAGAPALRDAARDALRALRAIHENEDGPAGQVAGQVIPALDLALRDAAGVPPADARVM